MAYTNSSKDNTKKVLRFLIPSWLDSILYLLTAFIILCIANFSRLWQVWSEGIAVDPATQGRHVAGMLAGIDNIRHSVILGDIFVLLFWAALGSIVYIAIWFTQNSLVEIKREAVGQHISGDMVRRNYLKSLLSHYIFFIALVVITKAGLYVLIFILLPAINTIFYGTIVDLGNASPVNLLWGLSSVVVLAVILHVLRVLTEIYSRFWRLYIKAH